MANFCIMRTAKLKSMGNIAGSLSHAFRERDTPNANQELAPRNTFIGGKNANEVMQKIKSKLPEKRRKDAVLAVEYLFTASPEIMRELTAETRREYFKECLKWLQRNFGAENLVFAGIHEDETTPHCYAYVLPLDNGKLNAKKWLGGRQKLSDMQSNFHREVGAKFEMSRGLKGSKAKHQTVKEYYQKVNQAAKAVAPEKPTKTELLSASAGLDAEWLDRLLEQAAMVPALRDQAKRASSLHAKLAKQQAELDTREQKLTGRESEIGDLQSERQKLAIGYKRLEKQTEKINAKLSESDFKHEKEVQVYRDRIKALENELSAVSASESLAGKNLSR